MKFSVIATAAIAQVASAHYFFDKVYNGTQQIGKPLEYIRQNTRPEAYNPTKWINTRDNLTPDMNDFRCNLGAFQSASRTKVLEVQAGTKLAMGLGVGATMRHPGPGTVWMAKAPGSVQQYEGDGDWFKIFEEGICDKTKDIKGPAWCTWDKDRIDFTIPAATPNGEYLVRAEHIGLHGAHGGEAEFYYGCLQVKVVGGGNGTPSPMYKFPGSYKQKDPAFNFSVWGGMKDYAIFGERPWTGANSSGGAQSPAASSAASPAASPAATPAASPAASPSASPTAPATKPAAHNSENCNGGKNKRGRRAFRESLVRKE